MNDEKKVAQPQSTMQNAVQQMLPSDLKKQFVLQKNSGTLGQEPAPQTPPSTPSAPPLDPNLIQKPMRTFESDLAEALRKKQGSASAISIAETTKRLAEMQPAVEPTSTPQPTVQRPRPTATAPTQSTAIPGVSISLPPTVASDPNGVSAEIAAALKATRPTPVAEPQPQPELPPEPAPVAPQKIPLDSPINVPTNVAFEEEPRKSFVKPILFTFGSLVLISAGVFAGYYYYGQINRRAIVPVVTAPISLPSVIPYDAQYPLPITTEAGNTLITKIYSEVNKRSVGKGNNFEITLLQTSGTTQQRMSGSIFISKLETRMPSVISRSLTDRFMLGIYGEDSGQKTTFLALTTDFFQNAFAGMLLWEDAGLADDLALLLNYKDRAKRDDLSTSTPAAYFGIKGTYSDRVLRNRDVREFRNSYGELLFLYSFINKETLVITTSESAFIGIVDRIEKDSYVR